MPLETASGHGQGFLRFLKAYDTKHTQQRLLMGVEVGDKEMFLSQVSQNKTNTNPFISCSLTHSKVFFLKERLPSPLMRGMGREGGPLPAPGRWKQEDQKFKLIFGYTASLRQAWDT